MSTAPTRPAQAPVNFRHADTPERWDSALARAKAANIKVYELGRGRYAVTSAHDPSKAYEVTVMPERCNCPAALSGDPVCIHRAIVRDLRNPQPEPPTHQAYDQHAEALQWAMNDRDRAYGDLEKWTAKIEQGAVLNDREWAAFMRAQERELDAHTRIVELTSKKALVAA